MTIQDGSHIPAAMGDLFLGLDLGTTGVRCTAINGDERVVAFAASEMEAAGAARDPAIWWSKTTRVLRDVLAQIERENVKAISVAATSGTMLGLDAAHAPIGQPHLYSDRCPSIEIIDRIEATAPKWSPVRAGLGGLACALFLRRKGAAHIMHQADWITFQLTGLRESDCCNALKSGFDPLGMTWPDWVTDLGLVPEVRPSVKASGAPIGSVTPEIAAQFGLRADVTVIAGTTDGCAAAIAAGLVSVGDAVTVLGTTLTIKVLSNRPVFAPDYGIYSHRLGDKWMVGGASNSGGGALLRHFSIEDMNSLGPRIDTQRNAGLAYHPLIGQGERFPLNDPLMRSRDGPRPDSDIEHLHALLEGVTLVEAQGYEKLTELGAPMPTRIFASGGGVRNKAWMALRERLLPARPTLAHSVEASFGSALLAKRGVSRWRR